MRTATRCLLVVAAVLAPLMGQAQSRFPTVEQVGRGWDPYASMPIEAAFAAMRRGYRLKLDNRFAGAVGELHQLATGTQAGPVRVVADGSTWKLEYAGATVATVPDLPSYTDLERV